MSDLPYRLSNATEGDIFFAAWCASCQWWDQEEGCPTHGVAMRFDVGDDEYPLESRYIDNRPTCTGYLFASDDPEIPTPRCLKTPDMFREPVCAHCPSASVRNIEGEDLCQFHSEQWSIGEGIAAAEYDNEEAV